MNIYVANIPFKASEPELKGLFEEYGEVSSAKIVMDKVTQRSRGFGFVEMASKEESDNAMKGLNNQEIEGRAMSVTIAREKEPRANNNRRW